MIRTDVDSVWKLTNYKVARARKTIKREKTRGKEIIRALHSKAVHSDDTCTIIR